MAENIKLARERAKIEREIAAIKKAASKEERAHTDSELKKLEDYRKRKRQIAKEQAKDEEASIANENKKYGLLSIQTQLQEKVMTVVKKRGKSEKILTMEYYKQGGHLHGFLETNLKYANQVQALNKYIDIGNKMFDSQNKIIQGFAPDYAQLVEGQKDSLDLSQKIGDSYDKMGTGSFQDLTSEAESQLEAAQRQKEFIAKEMIPTLEEEAKTLHGNSNEYKEIQERIKDAKNTANMGVRTAKNNVEQAEKLKVISEQTAAASKLITGPFEKLQGVLESMPMGGFISSVIGVQDVMDDFTETATTQISNMLDPDNPMKFGEKGGLAFHNIKGAAGKAFESLGKGFKMLISGARQFAAAALANPYVAVAAAIALIGVLLYKAMNYAEEMRQEFGITRGEAFEIQTAVDATAMQFKMLGVSAEDVGTMAQGIADSMGGVSNITQENLAAMAELQGLYGMSADSIAPAMTAMKALGAESNEAASAQLAQIGHMAQLEGVAPSKVFEDITSNMGTFSRFGKEGGKNLAKASIMARKLGTSLESMAATSDALLDFESNINDQMEASMLLGRSINMDKARELALTGDMAGQEREILKQIGTQAEFEAMNVVQRDALAKATGKSTEDLASMLANQANLNAMTDKERANKEAMQKSDEKMNAGMEAAGKEMGNAWSAIMDPLKEVMMAVQPLLGLLMKIIGFALKPIVLQFKLIGFVIKPIIKVLGWVLGIITDIQSFIQGKVMGAFAGIGEVASDIGGQVLQFLIVPFELLWSIMKTGFGIIASMGKMIFNALITPFQMLWSGIKAGFAMWVSLIKAPFNLIIAGVNMVINAINSLSVKVPDWIPLIGGQEFGFNLPNVPSLATEAGGPGHNVTQTGVAEVHKGESVGTFDMTRVEGKLDQVIDLLGQSGPIAVGVGGVKSNTKSISDQIV